MPFPSPPRAQVRLNRSGGFNVELARLNPRGFDMVSGRLVGHSRDSGARHTLIYAAERIEVDPSIRSPEYAITPSCLLAVSQECGGRTRNIAGFVDLARSTASEVDDLALQLNELSHAQWLTAGAVLVRSSEQHVFWSRLPHSALASRELRGPDVVHLLLNRAPPTAGRYHALSELLFPYLSRKWRPLIVLTHPVLAKSLAADLGLSVEYDLYQKGLHPEDPDIPAPSFYAADIPLRERIDGTDDDKVTVVLSKGCAPAKSIVFSVYLAPEGCADRAAWNTLRAEKNTQDETIRILSIKQ